MAKFKVGDYVTQSWSYQYVDDNENNILKITKVVEDGAIINYYTDFWITSINNNPYFVEFYSEPGISFSEYDGYSFELATPEEADIYKEFELMGHEEKLANEK